VITELVEGLNAHISALDPALQVAPEVLDAVSVDIPSHILFSMIDLLMGIVSAHLHIGIRLVAVQGGTRHYSRNG
jgi:hypothetical protein